MKKTIIALTLLACSCLGQSNGNNPASVQAPAEFFNVRLIDLVIVFLLAANGIALLSGRVHRKVLEHVWKQWDEIRKNAESA